MMNFRSASLLLILLTLGCSTSKQVSDSNGLPDDAQPVIKVNEEPKPTENWHLLSPFVSPFYGTGTERAYDEFLAEKTPADEVIVAIIDSGTDITHEDLKDNIWVNEDEIPGNGIDDDGNGYADDIHGWNFIGGPDGRHVEHDTYEVTRLYTDLNEKFRDMNPDSIAEDKQEEYTYYLQIKQDYEAEKDFVQSNLGQLQNVLMAVQGSKQLLGISHRDSASAEMLEPNSNDGPYLNQAKQVVKVMKENDFTEQDVQDAVDQFKSLSEYGLNPDFDPRYIVGDDYEDLNDRFYGNNDVSGVHNSHGTHVAGIVGAVQDNGVGMDGIAPVKLMILRAVPNGDERDKDVANAIRYAAENGANVINMSFGKGYSPQKNYVDAAVRFADSLGVLMVHGAGNDAENIDSTNSYPVKYYKNGGFAENYLTVGASSWMDGKEVPADFSNYGAQNVDIFAPGVAIYSTYPDNTYKAEDGTSMASPVVAGIAGLIMAYYPELSTRQVKEAILNSAITPATEMVNLPGSDSEVPFSQLSATGGIINAYEALKVAERMVSGN